MYSEEIRALSLESSRPAQPRRLFLGSTAAKMLKEITVPVIVVPRTARSAGAPTPEETQR